MQNTTLLQSIAQKNALFNSILKKSKNSKFITGIYTFIYGLFHKKPMSATERMKQCSMLVQAIYGRLGNDYSKKMYANRLLYNMTGDGQYMQNVIEMTKEGALFLQQLRTAQNAGKKIFIFGVKYWAVENFAVYKDINFCAFVDNNPKEKMHYNLPVLSFEEYLQQKDNSVILIESFRDYKEIYAQLKENNVKDENIINFGELRDVMLKRQYFDLPELRSVEKEHEIFVDCGCYDGETSTIFAQWHGNKKGSVYAFEADPQNKVVCEKSFAEIKKQYTGGGYNFTLFPLGVWSSKTVLYWTSVGTGNAHVGNKNDIKIAVDSLDNVLKDKEVTFIKMDIEGSECQALIGASNLIKKYKPKLAICIYHKYDDLLTIPEIILNLNPDYTLYVEHYAVNAWETVLYAI